MDSRERSREFRKCFPCCRGAARKAYGTRGEMISQAADYLFLVLATTPFIYYLLVLYSSWRFFSQSAGRVPVNSDFTPPVSNLKPVRGLDPEAYENFASYCRQDYPDYELIFCVSDENDAAVPVLEKLMYDFPERRIRVLYGSGRNAINDKVAKLVRLVNEARNEVLVINDSDVRVEPNYFRTVVAPLRDPKVGGVTCLYVSTQDKTFTQHLQSTGMYSDFYPGVLVARQLDGIKFTLGPTIVTTRAHVAGRRLGIAPERTLEMDAAHRGLGCDRVCDLVVDVRTQQHKVAQCRLQDSRGHARTRRPESCAESLPINAGGGPTPSWLLPPLKSQDPNAVPILRIFL